jgi:hypothetical protein
MPVQSVLPLAAVALAIGAVSGCSSFAPAQLGAQGSSSAQVSAAQGTEMSECDALIRRVEIGMPTALGFRLQDAQEDLREARELCSSGKPEEGSRLLRQILDDMHEEV